MKIWNRFTGTALIGLASVFAGCDGDGLGEPQADAASQPERGALGKTDLIGSCDADGELLCGGKSNGECYCDNSCLEFGDCCGDYEAACLDEQPAESGPPTAEEIFSDTSMCGIGAPYTREQALSFFEPGATSSPEFDGYRVYQGTRECNDVTGCGSWTIEEGISPLYYNFQDVVWTPSGGHYFPASKDLSFPFDPDGRLRVVENDIQLLISSKVTSIDDKSYTIGFGCNIDGIDGYSIDCMSGGAAVLGGADNLSSSRLTWDRGGSWSNRIRGTGQINEDCFRLSLTASQERRVVIYGENP